MAWTINPSDKSANLTLSNGNMTAACSEGIGDWKSARCIEPLASGKWYFEFNFSSGGGHMALGIATAASNLLANYVGGVAGSFGRLIMSQPANSKFSCAVDIDAKKLWVWQDGNLGTRDPENGTNPDASAWADGTYYPAITLYALSPGATINFGATSFQYTPPVGFSGPDATVPTTIDGSVVVAPQISITLLRGALGDIDASIVVSPLLSGTMQIPNTVDGSITVSPLLSGTIEGPIMPELNGSIAVSPVVSGTLQFGYYGNGEVTLPELGISASGGDDIVGRLAHAIPALELDAEGYSSSIGRATLVVPVIEVSIQGSQSEHGTIEITIPKVRLSATGKIEILGTGIITLPKALLLAAGVVSETGSADVSIPLLGLTASGVDGAVGVATLDGALELPALECSAAGYYAVEGTASLVLPALSMAAGITTTTYLNMVMNIRNNALSLYTNYAFNSFCRFNGVNLGATSSKIYNVVTGTTDDGEEISWSFKTPYLDMDLKTKKKLRLAWLTLKTDGDLTLTLSYPDGTSYEYAAKSYEDTEGGIRVKFGKGLSSRYIAMTVANVEGSTLELDMIRLQLDQYTAKR